MGSIILVPHFSEEQEVGIIERGRLGRRDSHLVERYGAAGNLDSSATGTEIAFWS